MLPRPALTCRREGTPGVKPVTVAVRVSLIVAAGAEASRSWRGMTFRVMGPHEWGRFAPEAWGHLLGLASSGALNGAELEQVIDRAMVQFEGRIALEDLRALIDGSGYDESGPSLEQVNIH